MRDSFLETLALDLKAGLFDSRKVMSIEKCSDVHADEIVDQMHAQAFEEAA